MLLLDHTCDVARNVPLGTNGRKQLAPLSTSVPCLFLPLGESSTIRNGYSLGRGFEVYFDVDTDIKVGDQLSYDGRIFYVRGVQPFKVALVGHLRTVCEQDVA